jgi:hypothetical protein
VDQQDIGAREEIPDTRCRIPDEARRKEYPDHLSTHGQILVFLKKRNWSEIMLHPARLDPNWGQKTEIYQTMPECPAFQSAD